MTEQTEPTPKFRRVKITELVQDQKNANKGSDRGKEMLEESVRRNGVGRSLLVDKDLEIIAGNKTQQELIDAGIDEVILIETDGKVAVAVQRTDLDLTTDPAARRLAIADNRVGEIDLVWNPEVLIDIANETPEAITGFWSADEWEESILSQIAEEEPEDEGDPDHETLVDQAVQLKPQMEYAVISCETAEEWEELKQILDLQPVRRGGYKKGSTFDHVGTQRVVPFSHFVELIQCQPEDA